jgi:hypothetical protein
MAALPSVRFLVSLTAALVCALALAACGGGGEEGREDLTAREITDEELVLMLLPKAEMGEQYAGLSFVYDPGLRTASDITDAALDPEEEAEDFRRFPLVSASGVVYAESTIGEETGEPASQTVALAVHLFEDTEAASGYLEEQLADWEEQVGTMRTGKRHWDSGLTAAEGFKPGRIADESRGIRFTQTYFVDPSFTVDDHSTVVWFRRGRLLASASISTTIDDPDFREAAEALARKLDERIQAVLRGELTPTPVGGPGA